jgi:transcriptional regulator with XRE-family HTH domain
MDNLMDNLTLVRFRPEKLKQARGDQPAASVARLIGISRQRLYAYETGEDAVPPDILLRLCLHYRKSVEWFSNAEELFRQNCNARLDKSNA